MSAAHPVNGSRSLFSGCYVAFHKQLGDMVLLEPALSRLREYHGAPVRVMTRRTYIPLLKLMPGVDFVWGLPLMPCSSAYCYDHLTKSATRVIFTPTLSRRLVLPEQREVTRWHKTFFRNIIVPELGNSYIAKYLWENTPVPTAHAFRPPRLTTPPEQWRSDLVPRSDYILCSPTAGWKKKNWGTSQWIETLRFVRDLTKLPVFLVGSSTDWQIEHCRKIASGAGSGVTSIAGNTSMENYLSMVANARMMLAVDGAAAHLASAFDVPSLTLFGNPNIVNWHLPSPRTRAILAPAKNDEKLPLKNLPADPAIEMVAGLWNEQVK